VISLDACGLKGTGVTPALDSLVDMVQISSEFLSGASAEVIIS
jgi:hypothetical protein